MKKIFLDCGTHFGQGLEEFIRMYSMDDSWDIYSFEPNKNTYRVACEKINYKNVKLINKAVYTYDGEILLNIETNPTEGPTGMGSSVMGLDVWNPQNFNLGEKRFEQNHKIECIDFSKFVTDRFEKSDLIIIKMDIEGSEYDVLEKMVIDNSIDYVNDIYVEFHASFFITDVSKRERELIEKINNRKINLKLWY